MIVYNYYDTLEQRPLIVKHLQEYNVSFTGIRPVEDRYFYVFENKKLKGAIYTHLGWDWVTFSNIFYDDIEIFQLLLSKICLYFKEKAVGITYDGDDMDRLNDFYKIGFTNEGIIEKTPKSKEKHITTHTSFNILSNSNLEVIQSSKVNEELDVNLKEILSLKDEKKKSDIIFVASDDDNFVGGVHGEITEDKMYISLLVVTNKYKGQRIGTKLMDLIEEKAISKGVVSIDLGTCDFQAKPFYEKRGYIVISTLQNYPKGFNEYTLIKRINN